LRVPQRWREDMDKATQQRQTGGTPARTIEPNYHYCPAQDDPHDEWKRDVLECWLEASLKLWQIAGHPDVGADEVVVKLHGPPPNKKPRRKAA